MNKIPFKRFFSILQYLFYFSIGIGLLYFAFRNQNFNTMMSHFKNANYWWVLFSVIFIFAASLVRAVRWGLLIEPLGYKPGMWTMFSSVMIAYLTNLAAPRLGEILRCGVLKRTDKIPLNSLFGTVLIERFVDFICLIIVVFIAVMLQFSHVHNFFYGKIISPILRTISTKVDDFGSLMLYLFTGIIILGIFLYLKRNKLKQFSIVLKVLSIINGLYEGMKTILKMKKNGYFLFHTVLLWFLYYIMTYICFFSLEVTSSIEILPSLFVFAMGGIGMSMPVQGGIGTFHWAIAQSLVLYNVSETEGLVFATIIHTTHIIFTLIVGGLSVVYMFYIEKKNLGKEFKH